MSSLRNWTHKTTDTDWAVLAKANALVTALIVANTSQNDAIFSIRIIEGSAERATIIKDAEVKAGESIVVDVCRLNLGRSDSMQVKASQAGVDFTASGEID